MKRAWIAFLLITLGMARLACAQELMPLRLTGVHDLIVNKTVLTIPYVNEDPTDPHGHFIEKRLLVEVHPDQTVAGRFLRPGDDVYREVAKADQDKGRWHFKKSGAFCMKWAHWYHKEQICTFWYPTKNGYLVTTPQGVIFTLVEKSQIS